MAAPNDRKEVWEYHAPPFYISLELLQEKYEVIK